MKLLQIFRSLIFNNDAKLEKIAYLARPFQVSEAEAKQTLQKIRNQPEFDAVRYSEIRHLSDLLRMNVSDSVTIADYLCNGKPPEKPNVVNASAKSPCYVSVIPDNNDIPADQWFVVDVTVLNQATDHLLYPVSMDGFKEFLSRKIASPKVAADAKIWQAVIEADIVLSDEDGELCLERIDLSSFGGVGPVPLAALRHLEQEYTGYVDEVEAQNCRRSKRVSFHRLEVDTAVRLGEKVD